MKAEITLLPVFKEPSSLEEAALLITQLGKNMGEHAYIIGKILIWVKAQLKHGEFLNWIKEKVWFKDKTAENFVNFAKKCDKRGFLLDEPHYLERPKFVNFTNLEPPLLPPGKYNVIYADPPWQYEHPISDSRRIERQYSTMKLEGIKELKTPSADDSILFLWSPASIIRHALEVMDAWGFVFRTTAIWDKGSIGPGYWFRTQHEILLIGIKGNFHPPETKNRVSSVYKEKRSRHSKKPKYYYELIEKMYPGYKYLELFARPENKRENWNYWGIELHEIQTNAR